MSDDNKFRVTGKTKMIIKADISDGAYVTVMPASEISIENAELKQRIKQLESAIREHKLACEDGVEKDFGGKFYDRDKVLHSALKETQDEG